MRRSPPMASNLNSIPSPRGYARRVGRMRSHAIRARPGKLSVRAQSCGFSRVPENKKGTAETVPCLMRVLHAYTLCESDPFQSQAALKLRFQGKSWGCRPKPCPGFHPGPRKGFHPLTLPRFARLLATLRYFPSLHSAIICAAERVISSLKAQFHLRLQNASSQRSKSSPSRPCRALSIAAISPGAFA